MPSPPIAPSLSPNDIARGDGHPRLLLVGVGHAHMEVLRRLAVEPREDLDLQVVSLSGHHHYSGMVPGYLAGAYREEEIAFDLPPLIARARGTMHEGKAVHLDPAAREVELEDGRRFPYDLVSFNVGSRPAGQDRPEVAAHAALVKPMSRAVELRAAIEELARGPGRGPERGRSIAVVGAGAAGFEVACAAARVLADAEQGTNGTAEGQAGAVTLLDAGAFLSGYSEKVRGLARRVLADHCIALRTGSPVEAVEATRVRTADGEEIPADLTIWLTGAVGQPIFRESGLPVDDRGFLWIDGALRSPADPRVFAVGDCGTLVDHPETPKAGVYAVRQGPVLFASLTATLAGRPLPRYLPQSGFLSILNTADGKALLRWKGVVSHSRWAWRLKDWIDRRFMEKYQHVATGR